MPRLGSNLPLRGKKSQLYEGGIRTPALASWPGTLAPHVLTAPIHVTDWMPTLSRRFGCPPSAEPHWDGTDIWPLLTREALRIERKPLYWNFRGNCFGARDGDTKLIAWEGTEPENCQLYDVGADPHETRDLVGREPETVCRLLEVISEERKLDGTSKRPDVE